MINGIPREMWVELGKAARAGKNTPDTIMDVWVRIAGEEFGEVCRGITEAQKTTIFKERRRHLMNVQLECYQAAQVLLRLATRAKKEQNLMEGKGHTK